jgi:iron(II)-dependent oxidoreductase
MHTKTEIQALLDAAHARIVALIESLDEAQLEVPFHPGVNPPVWEAGHTAFFFEYFLLRRWGQPPIRPQRDEVWDSFVIDHEDRWLPGLVPTKAQTLAYAREVQARLSECIATRAWIAEDVYLYRYAAFHQWMHVESMIWARQTLGHPAPPFSRDAPAAAPVDAAARGDAVVTQGRYRIGMPAGSPAFAGRDFAFDNEKPGFEIELPAFAISRTLVSNRDFLAFVEAGGYDDPSHWSWGGRKWLRAHAAADRDIARPGEAGPPCAPIYWKKQDGQWWLRRFDRWIPLPPEEPVMHVCYWEAEAWCNWAGRRLPTEIEWEAAALGPEGARRALLPWGEGIDEGRADMDAASVQRVPVSALAAGDSAAGCRQMIGTAWEWTSSQFLPYDGFAVDMYPFMSTLQFGSSKVTRGGSWATASALIRGTYRQACLPQRRDVFVGFRSCARQP